MVYSFQHSRHMLPTEALLVQGFPVVAGTDTHFKVPWAELVTGDQPTLSRAQIMTMAGNTIHAQMAGTLLVYIFSRVCKTPTISVKAHKLLSAPTFEWEED